MEIFTGVILLSNVKIKFKGSLLAVADVSVLLVCFGHGLTKVKTFLLVTASESI